MPRPGVGNPGNKGGRRKSAYEEEALAKKVIEAFAEGIDLEEVQKTFKQVSDMKGKVKLIDLSLAKATYKDKVLLDLLRKVLPDKISQSGEINVKYDKEFKDRSGKY